MNKLDQSNPNAAQSGGYPFRALSERWATAIDGSLELGLEFADPFATGWANTGQTSPAEATRYEV